MSLRQSEMKIVNDHRIELRDKALLIYIGRLLRLQTSVDALVNIREDISKNFFDRKEPVEEAEKKE